MADIIDTIVIKHSKQEDKVSLVILSHGEGAKKMKAEKNPKRLDNASKWSKIAGGNNLV